MKRPKLLDLPMNNIVKFLTFSDVMIWSGWGLVSPIMAVFFTDKITDGSIAIAGVASTIYFLFSSIFQIPVAAYIDKHRGEKDDFYLLVIGSLTYVVCAFAYIFATKSAHVYIIQAVMGFGVALSTPTWNAIFTRHLDKNREAMEWSIYNTLVGVGSALTAAIGGLVAQVWSYDTVFIIIALVSLVGVVFILKIARDLKLGKLVFPTI